MPSKSKAQHNLMEAAAHGAEWAQKKVPAPVAEEYVQADKNHSPYHLAAKGRKEPDRLAASHLKRKR